MAASLLLLFISLVALVLVELFINIAMVSADTLVDTIVIVVCGRGKIGFGFARTFFIL